MTISRRIPTLILVTDWKRALLPLPILAQKAIAGGVDLIQIREKDLNQQELESLVAGVVNAVGDRSKIAINGAPDLAAKFGIGLHLPESGPAPSSARSILGPDTLIGRSVHSPASARNSEGADYLIAGHVFTSTSKPGLPPLGIPGLRSIVESTTLPVIAIGGITAENVESVLATGAHGVAVISAINNSHDPENAARSIDSFVKNVSFPNPNPRERSNPLLRLPPGLGGRGGRTLTQTSQETHTMTPSTTIELTINGKQVTLDTGSTISTFLQSKGLEERLVVVELNESILPRTDYPSTILNNGDRVEIVHFVGGG